jgi:hypothetical protein
MEVRSLTSIWNVVTKFAQRGMDPAGHIESFLVNVEQFLEGSAGESHEPYHVRELCQKLDQFSAQPYADVPEELLERLNKAASEIRKLIQE